VSMDMVYAVRFGSSFEVTIWGRSRDSQSEGGMGVQIRPEVCRIMNAIFSVVTSLAAIIKSPSFSRERSSRTTMNSPFSGLGCWVSHCKPSGGEKKFGRGRCTECSNCIFYTVELVGDI
jgi:hypothetical protein